MAGIFARPTPTPTGKGRQMVTNQNIGRCLHRVAPSPFRTERCLHHCCLPKRSGIRRHSYPERPPGAISSLESLPIYNNFSALDQNFRELRTVAHRRDTACKEGISKSATDWRRGHRASQVSSYSTSCSVLTGKLLNLKGFMMHREQSCLPLSGFRSSTPSRPIIPGDTSP